jgi:hypothetical protein
VWLRSNLMELTPALNGLPCGTGRCRLLCVCELAAGRRRCRLQGSQRVEFGVFLDGPVIWWRQVPKLEELKPYSRREVLAKTHVPPDRGPLCTTCGSRIPQFDELVGEPELRVLRLIKAGRNIEALKELQRITGCSLAWAKLWVAHRGEPEGERSPTAPCPHCGRPLRTPRARQCRFCRRDWHSTGATGV